MIYCLFFMLFGVETGFEGLFIGVLILGLGVLIVGLLGFGFGV